MEDINIKIAQLSQTKKALLEKLLQQKKQNNQHNSVDIKLVNPILTYKRNTNRILLSFAQQRLWFLQQLEPNSCAYYTPIAIKIKGYLNIDALQQALTTIIERHESLRTQFIINDEVPIQVITQEWVFKMPFINLSNLSNQEQSVALQTILQEESKHTFKLTLDLMLRASLIKLNESEHILLIVIHHIASDGWSRGVFYSELSTLYQDFNHGKSSSLPPLTIQYADFAQWQRNWLQGEVLESQLSYWQEQLGGILPVLQLPTDYPRPPIQTYNGASVSVEISPVLTNQLKALSQQEGVTLFMTLLAAFQTLLYRYSGQEDIIVGTAIANRNREEIESLIGFFANTLALRINFSNHPSFQELLIKVREICLDAYSHQDIPFEKLVEELQPERNLSHNPIFQVMFVLQNTPQETIKIPDLTIESINLNNQTSKFDLTLSLTETTNGLMGTWEYNTDLFADATINRMSGHFQQLLTEIVANLQIPVTKLSILTARERHQLLIEWNQTQANYPNDKCIHQLFEKQVERTPDQVAVIFEEQELTYLELNQRANQLAHYLQKLGVKPEVLVGICVERSLEMIIGLLGILKAGGAYVPLDPNYPQERLKYMIKDSQVSIILTQESLTDKLSINSLRVVNLDSDWEKIAIESTNNLQNCITDENLAYVIYTSGSTGKSKGVLIEHQAIVYHCQNVIEHYNLKASDRILQFASLSFDVSIEQILPTLIVGATFILVDARSLTLREFHQTLINHSLTVINIPPIYLNQWLRYLAENNFPTSINQLRLVISGGESLPPETLKIWDKSQLREIRLINAYGPTETTITAITFTVTKEIITREYCTNIPIGRPLPNRKVYILDQHFNPVPIAVPGELYISGDGLARGYLNQPELTKEKFITNPFREGKLYKTGDLARYLPNGNIEYIGRIDHQVKIRGFRIELGEIEAILNQHHDVPNAVAIVREDNPGNKRIIAYITSENQATLTQSELRQFLKPKLPEHMIPSVFVILETLPLTPNGKVDRRALPIPEQIRHETEETFVTPRNELEQQLTKIWEVILGIQPISIRDNFFDLGGHSLLAVRLLAQIEKTFSINLPLAAIFQSPTIEELANILDFQGWSSPWYSLVPLQPKGSRPILFGIHNNIYFQDLIRHLGEEQPVYALHYAIAAPVNKPLTLPKMEDLAAHYIQEMRSLQPQGPYFLMGLSFGGVVAYEMAQQLVAQGQQVELLALFDSHIKLVTGKILPFSHRLTLLWNLGFSGFWQKAQYQIKTKFSQLISRYVPTMNRTKPFDSKYLPHIYNAYPIKVILNNYTPKSYSGRVVLFKAMNVSTSITYSVEPLEVVWKKFVNGELVVHEVPGNHTSILEDPNVQIIAETLTQYIDKTLVNHGPFIAK